MAYRARPVTGEDLGFGLLLNKLKRHKNVDLGLYRSGTLKRRIRNRMCVTGCPDYISYVSYLNRRPTEYDALLDAVTINVTEFFRDKDTFHVLGHQVIPDILQTKRAQKRRIVRAWSAGTSCGAEAYSVAILFLEAMGVQRGHFDVRVFGSDIDTECLGRAKAGVYQPDGFDAVDRPILEKYFEKKGDTYEVVKEVKRITRFKRHDLVLDEPLPYMDLILCRNVVIYFTKPLQEKVHSQFVRSLHEGGYLVLGRVETLATHPGQFFETVNGRGRIYKKVKVDTFGEKTSA